MSPVKLLYQEIWTYVCKRHGTESWDNKILDGFGLVSVLQLAKIRGSPNIHNPTNQLNMLNYLFQKGFLKFYFLLINYVIRG